MALTQSQRDTFGAIADVLIPATHEMPSASQVGVHDEKTIDHLLDLRDDLAERFFRGLKACSGKDPETAARALNESDPTALAAIGLLAAAGYYMSPKVMKLIGYPGQTARHFTPNTPEVFFENEQIKRVIARGPIFRPTPS